MKNRALLATEFILLCLILPGIIIYYHLAALMFFFLWAASAYCLLILYFFHKNMLRDIWKWKEINSENIKTIIPRWIICSFGMFIFMYFYDPERIFYLFYERPEIIPFIMVFYPVLSALPQEFIFCSFFFERYALFFKTERARIIASAIIFTYSHILFLNWVAPPLSFIAGIIFALTYSKTRSLGLVTLEHALYGNVLFVIGLGWYFWHGGVI